MQQHRALILRSNRFLGSALVDKKFVSVSDLEDANGKFMGLIQADELQKASILSVLVNETKSLDEGNLLEYLLDEEKLGLIDLNAVRLQSLRPMDIDVESCWASNTVPFDKVDGIHLLATSYYLSAPVVKFWNERLQGKLIWYAAPQVSITNALQNVEEIHAAEDAAAQEAEEEAALETHLGADE